MRFRVMGTSFVLAASFAAGCSSTTYQISGRELSRLAQLPPQVRGQSVRVQQKYFAPSQLGPEQPIDPDPDVEVGGGIDVQVGGPGVRGPVRGGGGGGGGHAGHVGGGGHGGGGGGHGGIGGGGDGKGLAIVAVVVAAGALVIAAIVEGERYDGFVQLHPMHPVWLFERDGSVDVMPLAAIDPQVAAGTDHAIVRSTEGPWRPLGRAPLDRKGFTYALLAGASTLASADHSRQIGFGSVIQLGYFPAQHIGVVGSLFLGWKDDAERQSQLDTRYTLELQGYAIAARRFHLGFYGGGGYAERYENLVGGDTGGGTLSAGALLQIDVNTRLALTARLGETYAYSTLTSDALFGLSVY